MEANRVEEYREALFTAIMMEAKDTHAEEDMSSIEVQTRTYVNGLDDETVLSELAYMLDIDIEEL